MRANRQHVLGAVIATALISVVAAAFWAGSSARADESWSPGPGETVICKGDPQLSKKVTLAVVYLIDYRRFSASLTAGDWPGIEEMIKEEEVLVVKVGTRARLIEIHEKGKFAPHEIAQVRLQDGTHTGKAVLLPAYWLGPKPR